MLVQYFSVSGDVSNIIKYPGYSHFDFNSLWTPPEPREAAQLWGNSKIDSSMQHAGFRRRVLQVFVTVHAVWIGVDFLTRLVTVSIKSCSQTPHRWSCCFVDLGMCNGNLEHHQCHRGFYGVLFTVPIVACALPEFAPISCIPGYWLANQSFGGMKLVQEKFSLGETLVAGGPCHLQVPASLCCSWVRAGSRDSPKLDASCNR